METITQRTSRSPITGKEYLLPVVIDDRPGIAQFLSMHPGKKVVVVQGLGFVGSVMGLVVANALTDEYAVIGIDLPTAASYWKIRSINEGVFPVIASDPKIDLYFQHALKKKNYYATYDPYAYSKADVVVVVDINLDVQKRSGLPDNYKIRGGTTKYLLRKIAEKYLPAALINQPKRGFEIPLKKWIDKQLTDVIGSYILSPDAYCRNYVTASFIENCWNRKINCGGEKRAKMIWTLFALEVWYKKVYQRSGGT